jgi:hypothetical protein
LRGIRNAEREDAIPARLAVAAKTVGSRVWDTKPRITPHTATINMARAKYCRPKNPIQMIEGNQRGCIMPNTMMQNPMARSVVCNHVGHPGRFITSMDAGKNSRRV